MVDLVQILKDTPKGTPLWSPICGECTFAGIGMYADMHYPIRVVDKSNCEVSFTKEGRYTSAHEGGECVLWPSKDNQSWENWHLPFKAGDFVHRVCASGNHWISIFKTVEDKNVKSYVDFDPEENRIYYLKKAVELPDSYQPLCTVDEVREEQLATPEEKEQLLKALAERGYSWNADKLCFDKIPTDIKEGDILFYRTKQNNNWVGIFDHISDGPFPGVYNKICVEAGNGNMYTSVSEYVKRGSYRLCNLREVEGSRSATPGEVQLLMNVLKKKGYYYDEKERKVKKLSEKPNFQYGDFIYTSADSEWLSIFEKNSDTEVLTVVDYSVDERVFYTCPAVPHGRLVDFDSIKECRLMTPEEKEVLVKALAKEGYRWNEEKKELEQIPEEYQFKPFERVLVRNYSTSEWCISYFSHIDSEKQFICDNGVVWTKCIPYKGNEHLLGTTENVK